MRLRCAMIFVKDMPSMLAFYRDAFGLAVIGDSRNPIWVELDAGGATVALHAIPAGYAADIVIASPPVAREETPLKLVFDVPDVAVAREQLSARGATMMAPSPWGSCDGLDPEGNVFQIAPARKA
jgi:predicted enzyme related to lactoylglutathione lyase